ETALGGPLAAHLGERRAGLYRRQLSGGCGRREAEAGCHLLAQVGIDLGERTQTAFLDRVLVALAELEGEPADEVLALDRRQAEPEEAGLREVVGERLGRLADLLRGRDRCGNFDVPAFVA